jgi:hypothetical protein
VNRTRFENITLNAELYYRAFPVDKPTENHKIILEVVPLIKSIMGYRGYTRGSEALPKNFLVMKYDEIYQRLQDFKERVNRNQTAYRVALNAISDAEDLLDYIFI